MFAEIVFPLPFRNPFTYSVPDELIESVQIGVRVVAPFGKRVLTGYVINLVEEVKFGKDEKIKSIYDVLDSTPIFTKDSLKFYEWISEYYLCSIGEALKNSAPYGIDVETKKKIVSDREFCKELLEKEKNKKNSKAKILEILCEKDVLNVNYLQRLVKKKNIYSTLRALEKIGAVTIHNEVEQPKVKVKKVKYVKLAKSFEETLNSYELLEAKAPKQMLILMELLQRKTDAPLSEVLEKAQTTSYEGLINKGLIEVYDQEVERNFLETYSEDSQNIILTKDQCKIIEEVSQDIQNSDFKVHLLHGITGSGKTQVYIELAKKAIILGKSVLFLVPEISLTPQITSRLYNNFKDSVAVFHSRMSLGERYDSWRGILSGKYSVVVGARSALFSPLENIGFIVVDEEHDSSYKQFENSPLYHARDAAIVKAKLCGCPVLLGSATPSIESMYNAKTGKYNLLELKERVDDAKLPEIKLINVIHEKKAKRMENVFSKKLLDEIALRLSKKEGIIILQNRRGFATQVYCDDCGEVETCKDCSVPLVFHINKNTLQCHYCGFVRQVPNACTHCGSLKIKYFGTGTQRVEDELAFYFPEAKIERIDSDTTSKKGSLGILLNKFRTGEIDILVGTQMVSKGLDFSHVTLVGVIAAETSLWLPDFRADERTFQLLTQVAGRAGRSKIKGDVLIQTQNEKHFVLQKVLENNYNEFYQKEISLRENMGYPPFTRICLIEAKDEEDENAKGAINDFHIQLLKYKQGLKITPPSEAIIAKLKRYYRYQILVKVDRKVDPGGAILRNAIFNSFINFNRDSRYRNVKLNFDVDPQNIV